MNPTIYLHPKPTDQPEARFTGEMTVGLDLAPSIVILGGADEDTAAYMDRLSLAATRLAQAIREPRAAWQSYGVTI